jgi:phosphatidylserine/phosphatidylglycerophosphate/cardiolipin synthase-like enzyme
MKTLVISAWLVGSASTALACTLTPLFSPYDQIRPMLEQEIAHARQTIHCSLFGISSPELASRLITSAKRGVEVQIGLDKKQAALPSSLHRLIKRAGAEVFIKKTGVLEHNKFCVLDGEVVVMGSWNWSKHAQTQDNSELIIKACPPIVDRFEGAFQRIKERDR